MSHQGELSHGPTHLAEEPLGTVDLLRFGFNQAYLGAFPPGGLFKVCLMNTSHKKLLYEGFENAAQRGSCRACTVETTLQRLQPAFTAGPIDA